MLCSIQWVCVMKCWIFGALLQGQYMKEQATSSWTPLLDTSRMNTFLHRNKCLKIAMICGHCDNAVLQLIGAVNCNTNQCLKCHFAMSYSVKQMMYWKCTLISACFKSVSWVLVACDDEIACLASAVVSSLMMFTGKSRWFFVHLCMIMDVMILTLLRLTRSVFVRYRKGTKLCLDTYYVRTYHDMLSLGRWNCDQVI